MKRKPVRETTISVWRSAGNELDRPLEAGYAKQLKQDREVGPFRLADGDRGVYGISVAADLVGMGVQNLRLYEARGLLTPERSDGGTRRYSANDLDRLRRIGELLGAGLNLAGIAMVLYLEAENARLRKRGRPTHGSN